MSDSITITAEYNELLDSIKRTLAAGQLRAARAVNNVLVETYWQIGRDIVRRQQEQRWGARVIERLSADLRTANPGIRGLSVRNLRYMAALATRWPTEIVQCSVAQLPWSLVTTLLDGCSDQMTSGFYAQRAVSEGWTRPVLQSMIASRLHERSQPALTTFDNSVPEADRKAVREIVKDPFILDFLAADPVRERDLSKALTDNLARFRFVVFELKLGRFEPEYVGKLNFYVQLVDDHLRDHVHDDPTLGMLLVVGRDDVTVEVALRGVTTPLAVTEWRRLPVKVRQALPSAEDLTETMTRAVREIESVAA